MTAVVLDTEMRIADDIIVKKAEHPVDPVGLVTQFVPHEQRTAVDRADAEKEGEVRPPGQFLGADEGDGADEAQPQQRHGGPREPQIVGIRLHRGDDFSRRVVLVLAEHGVEQGSEAEHE